MASTIKLFFFSFSFKFWRELLRAEGRCEISGIRIPVVKSIENQQRLKTNKQKNTNALHYEGIIARTMF